MTDVIGRGTIEVTADASGVKAGIDDAKRSLKGLGDASKDASTKASQSIDRYIKKLEDQRKTLGMSTREIELYKLALRGASDAQLKAADSSLKLTEAYQRGTQIGDKIKLGFAAAAAGAVLAAGAIASSIKSSIDAADHLNDLSKKTGVAVDTLGGLGFAAGQAGGDLESIASAAGKLNKSLAEAGSGNKEFGAAFDALGINIRDASGDLKKADVVIAEVANKFEGYEDGPEKAAIALRLFGKAGADIIPLLNDGGKALAENVEYYKKYSGVTQETANNADQFNDTMGKIKLLSGSLSTELASGLLPSMQSIADAMLKSKENGGGLVEFIRGITAEINSLVRELISGTKEAGSFWNAILTYGTINPFKSVTSNVASYKEEIVDLTKSLERYKKAGADTTAITQALTDAQAKLKFLQGQADAQAKADQGPGRGDPRLFDPRLKVAEKKPSAPALPGKETKGKDTSAQEAKAQLAYDLEAIKKASAAEIDIYTNADKIMEAKRAAQLVDDKQYYAEKMALIQLTSQAQEAALLKEIERMQAESLAGKDKTDNDRKILDAQAKLAKVREDATVNIKVNGIQEKAAVDRVAQSYTDAKTAAQAYLDTVKRQNEREIEGVGKGQEFRDKQAAINQIEDKQTTARQGLEGELRRKEITQKQFDDYLAIVNDTYRQEVALYGDRTTAIKAKQGDWVNGATEALQNYADIAANVARQTEDVVSNAFHSMEDALVDFAMTGKLSFSDLARSIIADIIRIQTRQQLAGLGNLAMTAISGYFGATSTRSSEMARITAQASASAAGGYDIPSGVNPVVQTHAREMILPEQYADVIRNMASGGGGGGSNVMINVVNQNGSDVGVTQRQTGDGLQIDVLVRQLEGAMAENVAYGTGSLNAAIQGRYGLRPSVG